MPRKLEFTVKGKKASAFTAELHKVDRSHLYGSVRLLTTDSDDRKCVTATLASDGKTLIPKGGTALGYVNPDGEWIGRDDLNPVDLDGNEIEEVASSFDAPIDLEKKSSALELLDHNIRLTYRLDSEDGLPAALTKELAKGTIYSFGFSYRGGVGHDPAFILADEDDNVWLMITSANDIDFVTLEQAALCARKADTDEVEGEEEEEDALDFGMM